MQPGEVAGELGVMPRQFEAEGGRLGVDAVAAPDGRGVSVFEGAGAERGEQRFNALDQQVGRAGQLDGEGSVQHIGTGHALVHEAGVVADALGHPGEEGYDVMAGDTLDGVDGVHGGGVDAGGAGRAAFADVAGGLGGDGAEFSHRLGGKRLDLEPDAKAGLRRPKGHHGGTGIAGYHGERFGGVGGGCKATSVLPP